MGRVGELQIENYQFPSWGQGWVKVEIQGTSPVKYAKAQGWRYFTGRGAVNMYCSHGLQTC